MWREGGTRLSGEERNFTSLSLYLPPPSFAFFTLCCASRLLAGFPVRDSKNKCMKQVRTVRRGLFFTDFNRQDFLRSCQGANGAHQKPTKRDR